jgi:drug/metabolite transporter (DMT)-like permease
MASQSGSDGGSIRIGLAAVVAASILFSAKSVFFKLCYRYGTPPVVLQSLRALCSLPFFAWPLLSRLTGRDGSAHAPLRGKDALILALLGFSGFYLASLFDMVGLQYVTAGTERLVLYVYPTLVVIFSALLFRKPIPRRLYLPLALSYAGIALSFGGEASLGGGRPVYGGVLVFLSAVFYALFLVWQGRLVHRYGPRFFAAACMGFAYLIFLAQFFATYPVSALAQPRPVLLLAAFTAVFCNVVPVYLYSYGVQRIGAGRSAVASGLGPVSTLVLSAILLGETAGWAQILGLGLVVAGTLRLAAGGKGPDQDRGGASGAAGGSSGRGSLASARSGRKAAPELSDPAASAAAFLASARSGRRRFAGRGHSHARRA